MKALRETRWIMSVLAAATIVLWTGTAAASPQGDAAVEQVSQQSYTDYMDLWLYTHIGDSRGVSGPEHDLCRDNMQFLFQSYGLTVALEPFNYSAGTYHNVVATQLGTVHPTQEYIVGAHYDSVSNPGADDDASGVAVLLEAARILSQYNSDYTIRYVGFSREEQGLFGSNAYVSSHINDDIQGMIQCDMVAYDPGTNLAQIYMQPDSPVALALGAAVNLYGDGLAWYTVGWINASDHAPFYQAGFDACLLIESEVWNNPYYHTQQDNFEQVGNLNFPYAVKMTRSVVGALVDLAGVQVPYDGLEFSFPFGQPEYVDPTGGSSLRVEVVGVGNAIPGPGTGLLHYDIGAGWQATPMDVVSDNVYDAIFPAADCGQEVLYYVSAETTGSEVWTDPWDAPVSTYSAIAGSGVTVGFTDNFETDMGWIAENLGAISGDWERGVPVNDPNWEYDPLSDSDGSGQCFLTQNQMGNTDVDGGAVRLWSPLIEVPEGGIIAYDYFLNLTESTGTDRLLVEAANYDLAIQWYTVLAHDVGGGLNWRHHEITPADLIAAGIGVPHGTLAFRFTVNDDDPQSIVEAGLDAFQVYSYDCCGDADGDMDENGVVNGLDLKLFIDALLGTPTPTELCHGDFTGGGLDVDDIPGMVAALLAG